MSTFRKAGLAALTALTFATADVQAQDSEPEFEFFKQFSPRAGVTVMNDRNFGNLRYGVQLGLQKDRGYVSLEYQPERDVFRTTSERLGRGDPSEDAQETVKGFKAEIGYDLGIEDSNTSINIHVKPGIDQITKEYGSGDKHKQVSTFGLGGGIGIESEEADIVVKVGAEFHGGNTRIGSGRGIANVQDNTSEGSVSPYGTVTIDF